MSDDLVYFMNIDGIYGYRCHSYLLEWKVSTSWLEDEWEGTTDLLSGSGLGELAYAVV